MHQKHTQTHQKHTNITATYCSPTAHCCPHPLQPQPLPHRVILYPMTTTTPTHTPVNVLGSFTSSTLSSGESLSLHLASAGSNSVSRSSPNLFLRSFNSVARDIGNETIHFVSVVKRRAPFWRGDPIHTRFVVVVFRLNRF